MRKIHLHLVARYFGNAVSKGTSIYARHPTLTISSGIGRSSKFTKLQDRESVLSNLFLCFRLAHKVASYLAENRERERENCDTRCISIIPAVLRSATRNLYHTLRITATWPVMYILHTNTRANLTPVNFKFLPHVLLAIFRDTPHPCRMHYSLRLCRDLYY